MAQSWVERLVEKAAHMNLSIGSTEAERLIRYLELLLDWNRKVNLTAITDPFQAIELHLLDSIAAAPACANVRSAIDLGAGGGLPGIVLAVLFPEIEWTLVDAVAKKVGFLKASAAAIGLRNLRAIHARAEGNPTREGLPCVDLAISRAFLEPNAWIELARHYLLPEGRVAAMLGAETELPRNATPFSLTSYVLPDSRAERRIALFHVEHSE